MKKIPYTRVRHSPQAQNGNHRTSQAGLSSTRVNVRKANCRRFGGLPSHRQPGIGVEQIGTVRELVSRNLSRLQADGLLKIDGREVTLGNVKALEGEIQ